MSEPYGAFVRLHVARADLVRWLETSPPDPARWTDWRDLGGRWCLDDGAEELAQATAEEMATYAREAGERLARWPTVRAAFRGLFEHCEAANTRHITYDCVEQEFVAGSWMYDENLIAFLAFLTLVRGAEDALGPDGTGVAVIHDYVFSPAEAEATAAMRLGPGKASRLLGEDEQASAVAVFQAMMDGILADLEDPPLFVDQLDEIR
jgi:hypothetical protein